MKEFILKCNSLLSYLDKLLFSTIFLSGVIFFFLNKSTLALIFFASFAFIFFLSKVVDRTKISQKYKTLIYVFIWLHLIGTLYFYGRLIFYDKVLHFVIPFFITFMVYDYIKKYKLEFPRITILLIVLGMLVLFEFFEYFIDSIIGFQMVGVYNQVGEVLINKFDDTMLDLISGMFGALAFLIFKFKKLI